MAGNNFKVALTIGLNIWFKNDGNKIWVFIGFV